MRTILVRLAAAAGVCAGAWAIAGAASACPVGRPVLANGSPGVVVGTDLQEGRTLCRVRFVSGVELGYESAQVVKATPADSREERPVPGANLPIAAAIRGGAHLCRPGVSVVHGGKRATVQSVRTEGAERVCTIRMEGEPILSLRSGDVKVPETDLLPTD